jgi:hypothetical protein
MITQIRIGAASISMELPHAYNWFPYHALVEKIKVFSTNAFFYGKAGFGWA